MKKFFEDFKAFAMRGNVIDMAVGVIIGAAFGSITTSLVNDIFMPLIGVLTGGINFRRPVRRARRRQLRFRRGGRGGRCRHDQLRPVHPERHQLHPDRVLHVPRHPRDEQDPQEAGTLPRPSPSASARSARARLPTTRPAARTARRCWNKQKDCASKPESRRAPIGLVGFFVAPKKGAGA